MHRTICPWFPGLFRRQGIFCATHNENQREKRNACRKSIVRDSWIGLAPLLNLYSFFYFGLCLVSGIAFVYFMSRKEDLTPTFRGLLVPLFCLFFWSVAWSICNSFVAPWTAYVFVFLKNPVILVLGIATSNLAFGFQENSFPRWKTWSLRLHIVLATLAILSNGIGFFTERSTLIPKWNSMFPTNIPLPLSSNFPSYPLPVYCV